MNELSVSVFVPIVAELQALAKEAQAVDTTDLEAVKKTRLVLRDKRVEITKKCKEFRDDANAFAKAVIAKEKELVAIIEPEEERFKEIEAEVKAKKEREERLAILPTRKERLASIGDNVTITDEELLDMDGSTFEGYINARLAAKNEADRAEIARKEAELKEREEAAKREEEAKAREEKARQEERERIEREQKEKEEREAREKEAAAKAEAERLEREKKEEEEKVAKRERAERYKTFRVDLGWSEETKDDFYEKVVTENGVDTKVILFKKVGEFDLTQL